MKIKLRDDFSWEKIKSQLNGLFIANNIPVNELFKNTENSEQIGLNVELKKENTNAHLYHYDEEFLGECIIQLIALIPDQITLKQASVIIAYLQATDLLEITTQELAELKANLYCWENKSLTEITTAVITKQHNNFFFNPFALIALRKLAQQGKPVTVTEDILTTANPLLANPMLAETITQMTSQLKNNTHSSFDEIATALAANPQVESIAQHIDIPSETNNLEKSSAAKINYYVAMAQLALIKKHYAKLAETVKQLIKIDQSFDEIPILNNEQLLQRHSLLCNLDNLAHQLCINNKAGEKAYHKAVNHLESKRAYFAAYSLRSDLQVDNYQRLSPENTLAIYNKRAYLIRQNNFLYLPGNKVKSSSKLLIFAAYSLFFACALSLVTTLIASHGLAVPALAVIGYSLACLLPANLIIILASSIAGIALFTLAIEIAKPGYLQRWLCKVITNPFVYAKHKVNTEHYKTWQKLFIYPWHFCFHMVKAFTVGIINALKVVASTLANWLIALPHKIKNSSPKLAFSTLVIGLMQKFDVFEAKKAWNKALTKAPLKMLKKAPAYIDNQLQQAQLKITELTAANQQLNSKLKAENLGSTSTLYQSTAGANNEYNNENSLC